MKMAVVVFFVLMGFYWLVDHAAPLPLNHEQFGLYYHNTHRAIGVVCFVLAGVVARTWQKKS